MFEVIYRRDNCRGCEGLELELVLSLKPSPIGDAYVKYENINNVQPNYPIDLYQCKSCGLAQLIDVIDPEILYGEYLYVTGSSSGLSEHFQAYADRIIERCELQLGALVVDLGSNDGTMLGCFKKRGMSVIGVEPAKHIADKATAIGVTSISKFFSVDLANEIATEYGFAKIITANNVFANIDNLMSWVSGINNLLAEDGVFIFESYYLADLVQNLVFDFIYHEHLSSFSVKPIQAIFQRSGLELVAVERVSTKGGSLRYYVQRPGGPIAKDGTVMEMLEFEERIGIYRKETFVAFAHKINRLKMKTINLLSEAKSKGKTIVGFGASITGTTLIYHFEIGKYLDYLVDDNQAKQGRFSPGRHLPVYAASMLVERKPDYVIILAWRFAKEIISKNHEYVKAGGQFLIPIPDVILC